MRGWPVTARSSRIAQRLASVAVSAKLHCGTPNRRLSSAPTAAASAVGSMVLAPPSSPRRRVTAATTGAGECPAIAAVSPRQKSMYSCPSTSVSRAPRAVSR
nr:hypothetical protein GCM10020092_062610 [Actinoplanes digitatis]